MLNRNLYQKDPETQKLMNQGVANVNDDETSEALRVLRYELETFVCDGQYEKGLSHILNTFLKNINHTEQPAVWISGFFGSGKSHLAKMLRALWVDTKFEDGASARGIANLPLDIKANLRELSNQGKINGGLHAVSGTLGAAAQSSARLNLIPLIFKSVGLPSQYHLARFVMWLQRDDSLDRVRNHVEKNGFNWEDELSNFFVAEGLHAALVAIKPTVFPTLESCHEIFLKQYPSVDDISNDDMLDAIKQTLSKDGVFPLTLIVLDEVQQYIGEDSQRSLQVQELVESCSKKFKGKLLFIGTGQTAVTGTSNLKKLEGRFTVRVELSDADVDAVIRKVILAKKPEAITPINDTMITNLGEISRHLKGTTLSHREDDTHDFSKDYPILPTRRRFWENALRVLDQTGTDSQLRNQLNMVHKAIQTNLDSPLGHVIPADYLYFDLADKLVQTSVLPRKFHETTMKWITSPEGENKLIARACGIVFLISKLSGQNSEIGIKANIDTLADLLVEDLSQGSSNLRATLPNLLEKCELLLKVDDEFRIQTQESAAWNDEFNTQINTLSNNIHGVHLERDIQIRKKFEAIIGKLSKVHGKSKVTRKINIGYDTDSSPNENNVVNIWVRDGWSSDEDTVRSDSRQAGLNSPTIFLFIPRHSADNLLLYLTTYKAAVSTLERRGDPNSPEGQEARDAMLTRKTTAEQKFSELLDTILENTCVFQGGGNEIVGSTLKDKLQEAFNNSLKRLYLKFDLADSDAWNKVYEQAKKGFADSLQKINHQGNPEDNDVCKAILGYIGGGKDGLSLRNNFELPPYGWPRDAIDGALQALLVSKLVLAHDDRSQVISPKDLDRRDIGKTRFKLETVTISAKQFLRIRGLFLEVGVFTNSNEELKHVPLFLEKMQNLLDSSGGDAPKPDKPPKNLIDKIKQPAGNEQLLCIYEHSDELSKTYKEWTKLSEKINIRLESWNELQRLVNHASGLKDMTDIKNQVLTIKSERQLIFDPDPIQPLIDTLTQKLRDELNRLNALFSTKFAEGQKLLEANPYFNKLDSHQKNQLLSAQRLLDSMRPKVDVETTGEVLKTLDNLSLTTFADRVEALKERFNNVALEAARILEPQAHSIQVPRRTLKSTEEVDTWLKEVEKLLKTALDKGPIIIQ